MLKMTEEEYGLCVKDVLLLQTQGYDVKLIEKFKNGALVDQSS